MPKIFHKKLAQMIAGGGGGAECPFDMSASVADSVTTITFPNWGTVNNVIPSNITSSLTCSATGTFYVVCRVTTNTNSVSSAQMVVLSTAPIPPSSLLNAAPPTVDVLIGLIIDGTSVKSWKCAGITLTPIEAFRTSKTDPVPFGAKYNIYYTWSIS